MINLKYLVSILKSALYESTSNVIEKSMFLNDADIQFLKSNGCILSISNASVLGRYKVELDRQHIVALCN